MLYRKFLLAFAILLLIGLAGCASDEPITSPHAAAVVYPQNSKGAAYLFASNRFLDRVYRIDLESLDVKVVKVGKKPRNIAPSPDGNYIAVANEEGASITIIGTANLCTRTIMTGFTPKDVRFSPDGKWIAVANYDNESVALVDARQFSTFEIWVGGGPASVAFDETSTRLAVACYDEDSVKIIDVETKEIERSWFGYDYGYDRPQVILFGRAGTPSENMLFVGNRKSPGDAYEHGSYDESIAILHLTEDWIENLDFQPVSELVTSGANPRGLLLNHDGDRLITLNYSFEETETDTLSMIAIESQGSTEIKRFISQRNPVAAALASNKDLLAVANKNSASVSLFDLEFQGAVHVKTVEKPYALAFNPSGTKVVVVHETPLMPVSIVDVERGTSKVVIKSASMNDWVE